MLVHWWVELVLGFLAAGAWESQIWCFDPLVCEAGTHRVLEQIPIHWLVRLVLGLMPSVWWVELNPNIFGCRTLGILVLVLVHWCVGTIPGLSGGKG